MNDGGIMERVEYLIMLYDYYGELFNEQQRRYFEGYYFENLSLSELADNEGKSRNAIHKGIKSICFKLNEYEKILHLYEKGRKLQDIVNKVTDYKLRKELEELL